MQVRRLAAWAIIPLAATLGLSACGGGGSGSTDPDGVVSIGIGEPQFLTPANSNETSGGQVLAALYAPLVDFDDSNKPFEVTAQEITSEDSKTWIVKLKEGWTFHNGETVTADNYVNAWNYAAYGPNAQNNAYFFEKVEGAAEINPTDASIAPAISKLSGLRTVDENTFEVTLSAPFSDFKSMVGYSAFYPLPDAAFEDPAADPLVIKSDFQEAPIGNGAFKMKGTWEHDNQIEVERYDDFKGEKPKIGGATFKIYQNDQAQYNDLLGNNIDVVKSIPTESMSTVQADLGDRYQTSPASTFQFLAFPTYDPRFSSPEVRQAISMAIDREEIIEAIFQNSQESARSFVSPVVAGYRPDTCGDNCKFDAAAAKAKYEAAGGPASINISYNADGGHKQWIDATCNQLSANLGIECLGTPEAKFADMLTKLDEKQNIGMFRLGWVMDYPSMENYLGPLYTTTGSTNLYGYSNAEFDRLVAEGSAETSEAAGIAKYQEAEDILATDMPVIPLRFGKNNFGHSTNVDNVKIDLFNRVDLNEITYQG